MQLVAPAFPGAGVRSIALAGNPNSGKTTVFNALTGLRQKVANYPGVTVDKKVGRCHLGARTVDVLDLPGTYSLVPNSPDEQVTAEVLRGLRPDTPPPDAIVAVVDASNLPRSLYLITQLIELRRPLAIALNMSDIAERRGLIVDQAELSRALGVPVAPMVGHRRRGLDQLRTAIGAAVVPPPPLWDLPRELTAEIRALAARIAPDADGIGGVAHRLLIGDPSADLAKHRLALAEPLAQARERLAAAEVEPIEADIAARYRWIDELVARVVRREPTAPERTATERVDAVLMHPVAGLAIFALVMTAVFVSVFWVAKPLMDGLQGGIGWLGGLITAHLAEGPLKSLLDDGIIKGVGAVVVFVPQIAILFLFLAILEDSGYLARAAFLMDRVLAKVGLHGKSFIPLLSSFACAIPGVMATRTIDGVKDRLATILVAPFMSCSARLPVYFLLIGTCFAPFFTPQWRPLAQGLIMLACYALGIIAAAVVAFVFRRSLLKRGRRSTFIMEMPSYKFPQFSEVVRQMWVNARQFLTKAGTIIFALSVLLWAAMYWPRLPAERAAAIAAATRAASPTPTTMVHQLIDPATLAETVSPTSTQMLQQHVDDAVAAAQISQSYAGRFGHAIAPALAPIGCDWKTGIGLVGAFAAREVFVSTLGIVYGVGDTEDDTATLSSALSADRRPDGRAVWTPLVAATVLIWFVLAMQCMSTVAVVRRETGGWKWPLFQLVYMNALAYVVCLGVYQVGSRLWGG
jgi:ferrous iron transport protein B